MFLRYKYFHFWHLADYTSVRFWMQDLMDCSYIVVLLFFLKQGIWMLNQCISKMQSHFNSLLSVYLQQIFNQDN